MSVGRKSRQQRRREAREAAKRRHAAGDPLAVVSARAEPGAKRSLLGQGLVLAGAMTASAALMGLPAAASAQEASPQALAQPAQHAISIDAGSLRRALDELSGHTGLVIVDPGDLAGDLDVDGLEGSYSIEGALRALLGGTGVTYRFTNARAIRLERGELPPSYVLPGMSVVGSRQELSSPKYGQPLQDVPQTVTLVSAEVMQQQGVTTLREALRNVPGLTVNAGEGGATPGDNFNIRGFSARSDIFVDGVRDIGGYSRQTFNVEQVEIAKGPSSNYAGRGTTGGSINLVTKAPRPLASRSATAGFGTASYQRATVDVNEPIDVSGLGGVAVRLNAAWEDSGVAGLDEVERSTWGVAPSLAFGLGASTRLTLSYDYSRQDNIPSYGVQSFDGEPPVDTHRFFGLTDLDFEKVRSSNASATAEHDINEAFTLRNRLGYASSDIRRVVTYGNLTGERSTRSHITDDANVSNVTTLHGSLATGPVSHDFVAGVDVTREDSHFGNYGLSLDPPGIDDLGNPNPSEPYTGTITARRPRRNVEATTVGAYVFETLDTGPVELSGSVRFDAFSPQYSDSLGVVEEPATHTNTVSWRAGAVYKPVEEGRIYFGYGTSFNPSGELLAADRDGTNGVEDPEQNRSYEAGVKWDLASRRVSVTGAVFRTDKVNARIDDPSDPEGNAIILAGEQRVEGVELGVSGSPLPGWSLQAAYTHLRSEIIESDNPDEEGLAFPNTPAHTASVWSTFALPWSMEAGIGANHVGERIFRGRAGDSVVPAYTSVDAEVGVEVSSTLSLRLNLLNLTDATYYDTGRFWVPSAGRWLKLTTSVRF